MSFAPRMPKQAMSPAAPLPGKPQVSGDPNLGKPAIPTTLYGDPRSAIGRPPPMSGTPSFMKPMHGGFAQPQQNSFAPDEPLPWEGLAGAGSLTGAGSVPGAGMGAPSDMAAMGGSMRQEIPGLQPPMQTMPAAAPPNPAGRMQLARMLSGGRNV